MSSAQIKFSTDILRRLGEELNPSPSQGILELAKNAYDADARTCRIDLVETDMPGGTVRIVDSGDGMDEEAIKSGWLVLGRSKKRLNHLTRLGRQPAGSKGLGRLAALRMGTIAKLQTRPFSNPLNQYNLLIDWNDYENIGLVEDVDLSIETCKASKDYPGTEILLENLRTKITRTDVKRLARELLLLADPFGDNPHGFEPILTTPEFSDLEALVKNRYFQEADYHLCAELDQKGKAQATVYDWLGKELFIADHKEITSGKNRQAYQCPTTKFDLWVFILNKDSFSTKQTTLGEVKSWLKNFGGVHLYQNGLRVSPYGNPGNDWNEMNLLRQRNPEERPGTNTSIGRVFVTDTNGRLLQKTDRSGFVESDIFQELKLFTQHSMEWMARRRLEVAEKRRAKNRARVIKRTSSSKKKIDKVIAGAPPEKKDELEKAFNDYNRSRDQEVKQLRKDIQLYRTLSTAGITAATFAHESNGNPIKVITQSIKAIERRGKKALKKKYRETIRKPVNLIKLSLDSLSVLGSATLKLVDHEKRRLGRVNLHDVISEVLTTFHPFLEGRSVKVKLDLCPGKPYLRGAEAAFESVLTNLLNNSLTAFEKSPNQDRLITLTTTVQDDMFILAVADNGTGVEGISKKDIWLPGQTTRPNGTGLGLTIVKDTVSDLGGTIDVLEHDEKLGGALFTIELPIIGV